MNGFCTVYLKLLHHILAILRMYDSNEIWVLRRSKCASQLAEERIYGLYF